MSNKRVLVVDDEPDLRELLSITLEQMDFSCDLAEDYSAACSKVKSGNYFLCLADMRLPDGDGIELVRFIQKHKPELPVAIITAFGNVEGAVNTLKAGAFDFVSKPINLKMLRELIATAERLSKQKEDEHSPEDVLLGDSSAMTQLREQLRKISRSQAPVYIHGESGTGKELVAKLIHELGPRNGKPFIPVNCGAIPQDLMESEFFGHKKGSFTGAHADKEGFFQSADGGSIFLDEIADLPMMMQVKLLRAIQEKTIRPIGETNEFSVDVRIISATHKSLEELVTKESFRQDLFYRLNVISLDVPPLRERKGDIDILLHHFLNKLSVSHQVDYQLSEEALASLRAYPFYGNVRELENIIERAVAFSDEGLIEAEHLHLEQAKPKKETPMADMQAKDLDHLLDSQEKEMIEQALHDNKWNKTKTAKQLGITLRALRYRLDKYGIE